VTKPGDNTLIPAGSSVFKAFIAMKRDDPAKFSGTFIYSDIDYVKEASLTGRFHDRARVPAAFLRCQPYSVHRANPEHGVIAAFPATKMLLKSTPPMTRPMTGLMTSLTRLPTTP